MSVSHILKVFDFFEIIHSNTLNFWTFYYQHGFENVFPSPDTHLNAIYSSLHAYDLAVGSSNFIENPCNVNVISTIDENHSPNLVIFQKILTPIESNSIQ